MKKVFFLSVFLFFTLISEASTVVFEKSIIIRQKPGILRSIFSFFFGAEKFEVKPYAITLLPDGNLCVTDSFEGTVNIIDENGFLLKTAKEAGGIKIGSPVAIALTENGHILISDSTRNTIWEFNLKLNYIRSIVPFSGGRITGIAASPKGYYCVNTEFHYIVAFDKEFREQFKIGKRGKNLGEFNYPTLVSTDAEFLYVIDTLNFRIQVFDHSGKFLTAFGKSGDGGGNFSKPKGLAVDSKKRIFVTDVMFDNLQIFSINGEFLYFFGSAGQGENNFWMPSGLAIDKGMHLYIADSFNNRIQKLKVVDE